jgi:Rha family phage regulatory protein
MSRPKVVRSILTTSLSQPIVTINGREYLYEALTHRNVSIRVAIRCEKAPHLWLAFKDLHVALNITKSDRLKLAFESVMLSHRALTTIKFPNGAPSEQRIISGEAFLSMFEIMDCFLYGTTDHIAFKAWLEDQLVRLNDKYNLTGLIPMVKGQEVVTDDYEAEDYDENDDCVPSPLSSTKTTVKYPPPKPVVKAQTMEETEDMSDDTTDDQVEILSCTDLVSVKDGMVIADSLGVAERFDKRHADVLEKARQIMVSGHPEAQRNFTLGAFRDKNGQNRPMIEMTRDGFSFLVMGFTGRKADDWKWKYIDAFNRMEAELRKPREQVAQPSPSVPSDSTVWAQILRQQGEQYKAMIESQQQAMASQQQFLGEIIDKLLTKVAYATSIATNVFSCYPTAGKIATLSVALY